MWTFCHRFLHGSTEFEAHGQNCSEERRETKSNTPNVYGETVDLCMCCNCNTHHFSHVTAP